MCIRDRTNDVRLHQHVRKRFIELQTALFIKKARRAGGGLVDVTREENIDLMIQVWHDEKLHLAACHSYKETGTMVALDGSEDNKLSMEAKDFWNELHMREKLDLALADIEDRYRAGKLIWCFKTVQQLITPYPRRGHLDKLKVCLLYTSDAADE